MKRSDLFREYARVIDMCEGTGIAAYKGVKQNREVLCDHARLDRDPDTYTFAIGICEGKPVFAGDVLWHKDEGFSVQVSHEPDLSGYSWAKQDPYADLKKAQADGKVIQGVDYDGGWVDLRPDCIVWASSPDKYRIKPEPVVVVYTRYIMSLDIATGDDHAVKCTWTDGVLTNVEIVR